ncbi:MAG: tRNA uridine-5-carboxymethylaminomethyl(34) synthesis enzyme MnmG [Bacteroidales bacterium]
MRVNYFDDYDIIVVGAGHAGSEAAAAAANLGARVLLITMDMTKIAQMSCNPAMGGIAKGQIIREIDALGGFSGIVTDRSMIQFRMLNRSKGPAMWSPRAQCDRIKFSLEWRRVLESITNLSFWQDTVSNLIIEDSTVKGVVTKTGVAFSAKAVVLTNGTFENGLIHIGRTNFSGGRISEPISQGISAQLRDHGFQVGRLKTGTPARLDGRTIDFSELEEQPGDDGGGKFSFLIDDAYQAPKMSCYITYTNPEVHEILRDGFEDSPLFTGRIQGVGPRYCPSIEDKIVTFSQKNSHQLFLEPEGAQTYEYYLNGFSSSLPYDVQFRAIRKIRGLERVKIFRPGYAIEYDYYPPTQLYHTLETKYIKNLFFAGQINGTTGYEEAAAQGIMAGINAFLKINQAEPFVLRRDEAYIGVLIDDLVTKGVDEPYRMFTSRAEFRLLLRQDNADERLTERSYFLGLASRERYEKYLHKRNAVQSLVEFLRGTQVKPVEVNDFLKEAGSTPITQAVRLHDLCLRPEIGLRSILQRIRPDMLERYSDEIIFSAELAVKYAGYIDRERSIAEKLRRLDDLVIPTDFDFSRINISTEAKQKLSRIRPHSVGQASRIPGVSPADINALLIYMGR